MNAVVMLMIVFLSNGEVRSASYVMKDLEECHAIGPALADELEKRQDVLKVGGGCLTFTSNDKSAELSR